MEELKARTSHPGGGIVTDQISSRPVGPRHQAGAVEDDNNVRQCVKDGIQLSTVQAVGRFHGGHTNRQRFLTLSS